MIVDLKEYAEMTNTKPGILRMKIFRAGKDPMLAGFPGVLEAKKKGNGWIFIIDAKKVQEYVKKSLVVS